MNGCFVISGKQIIETIGKTCQQNAAFFQNTETFLPNWFDILYITIRYRMKNQVEAPVIKREWLCHIRLNQLDFITFPCSNYLFLFQLLFRIIQYCTFCTQRRKNWHLLSSAAGKAKDLRSLHGTKPLFWNWFCWCQQD